MDVYGFWIPDIALWILVIVGILYIYGTWPYSYLSSFGYDGPKPVPFFGNLNLTFGNPKYFAECDSWLKKKYGDVVAMYTGRQPDLVVYDPEMLKDILVRDSNAFPGRRMLPLRGILKYSLVDLKGEEWKRVRALITPTFTTRKLKNYMKLLERNIENLTHTLDTHLQAGEFKPLDAKRIIGNFTMESICSTAFGLDVNCREGREHEVVAAAKSVMNPGGLSWFWLFLSLLFPFMVPFLDKLGVILTSDALSVMSKVVRKAITERQKHDEEYPDFIQSCLDSHSEELGQESLGQTLDPHQGAKGLAEEEIIANAIVFLVAGYDTTSTALSFLLFDLANHPQWQERVAKEIDDVIGDGEVTYDNLKHLTTLDMCLDETQRITPGLYRVDRRTNSDVTIKGHVIPKNTTVVVPVRALHHDPDFWIDPEIYNPKRFSQEKRKEIQNSYMYFPFGAGPRNCVGMRLALIEVKMAAVAVIRKYKWSVSDKTQRPFTLDPKILIANIKGGMWLNIQRR